MSDRSMAIKHAKAKTVFVTQIKTPGHEYKLLFCLTVKVRN